VPSFTGRTAPEPRCRLRTVDNPVRAQQGRRSMHAPRLVLSSRQAGLGRHGGGQRQLEGALHLAIGRELVVLLGHLLLEGSVRDRCLPCIIAVAFAV